MENLQPEASQSMFLPHNCLGDPAMAFLKTLFLTLLVTIPAFADDTRDSIDVALESELSSSDLDPHNENIPSVDIGETSQEGNSLSGRERQ